MDFMLRSMGYEPSAMERRLKMHPHRIGQIAEGGLGHRIGEPETHPAHKAFAYGAFCRIIVRSHVDIRQGCGFRMADEPPSCHSVLRLAIGSARERGQTPALDPARNLTQR